MASATVLHTTLDVIYGAIQAQLLSYLALNDNQVLIMDPEALPAHKHPSNVPFYMLLWPAPESASVPIFRGASSLDFRLTERFQVTVRTATALDEYKQKPIWLNDPGIGHLRLRNGVWAALLNDWTPQDANSNMLTIGPLEPAQSTTPKKTDEKRYFGQSALGFQFHYLPDLKQP